MYVPVQDQMELHCLTSCCAVNVWCISLVHLCFENWMSTGSCLFSCMASLRTACVRLPLVHLQVCPGLVLVVAIGWSFVHTCTSGPIKGPFVQHSPEDSIAPGRVLWASVGCLCTLWFGSRLCFTGTSSGCFPSLSIYCRGWMETYFVYQSASRCASGIIICGHWEQQCFVCHAEHVNIWMSVWWELFIRRVFNC